MMELADDVDMSVRRHGKKGRTVHITLKYSDFMVVTRQTTVPATCTTKEIYQAGCTLLEQNWNRSRPVRLLGISLAGFDEDCISGRQLSLFDQLPDMMKNDENQKIDRAMDAIRNKYGYDRITYAGLVQEIARREGQSEPPNRTVPFRSGALCFPLLNYYS